MFKSLWPGGRKSVIRAGGVEIAEAERVMIPFPSSSIPVRLLESPKQRSYEEIARKIGFAPAELIRAQLLEFFWSQEIKLYDYAQVGAWLSEKKEQANATHWCWRPLRQQDVMNIQWGYNPRAVEGYDDGFYAAGQMGCRPYDRLVPVHALLKVAAIEEKFGDQVRFFVSDYASPKADPFIMVRPATTFPGTLAEYHLVFDVWDEPGFGL